MRNRTRRGNPTAAARRRYGTKGKFPVFDRRSAISALKLRGHAASKRKIVDKVARYASRAHDATVKKAVSRARKIDRRK